jgi:hypothetical protein
MVLPLPLVLVFPAAEQPLVLVFSFGEYKAAGKRENQGPFGLWFYVFLLPEQQQPLVFPCSAAGKTKTKGCSREN